ncbi:MAG: OmpH family outer membrane protein [Gilvibacter sp.]
MKKLFIVAFSLMISLGAVAQTASKVGTIDVDAILSKMPEIQQVQTGVQAYGKELDDQLGVKLAKYDSLITNYQKMETTYGDAIKRTKQDEIINLENEMAQFRENSVSLLQIKQNELMGPLYTKIGKALEVVAKEQQYTQVIAINASLAYLDKNFDVTAAVMQKMGIPTEE